MTSLPVTKIMGVWTSAPSKLKIDALVILQVMPEDPVVINESEANSEPPSKRQRCTEEHPEVQRGKADVQSNKWLAVMEVYTIVSGLNLYHHKNISIGFW